MKKTTSVSQIHANTTYKQIGNTRKHKALVNVTARERISGSQLLHHTNLLGGERNKFQSSQSRAVDIYRACFTKYKQKNPTKHQTQNTQVKGACSQKSMKEGGLWKRNSLMLLRKILFSQTPAAYCLIPLCSSPVKAVCAQGRLAVRSGFLHSTANLH